MPRGRGGVRRVAPRHRRVRGRRRVRHAAVGAHQRPGPHRARAGAVHAPARPRRRARRRRHHRVVGRRRALLRDAERVEHRRRSSTRSQARRRTARSSVADVTADRAVLAVQGPRRGRSSRPCIAEAAAVARFAVRRRVGGAPVRRGHRLHGRGRRRDPRARRPRPPRCGTRSSTPASRPPGSARATRCASKPGCRCTATSSARASRRCRPGSGGSCAGTRATSAGTAPLEAERERGRRPPPARARRSTAARPARGAAACAATARVDRRGHERQLLADARARDRARRSCRPTSPTATASPSTCAGREVPAIVTKLPFVRR